MFCFSVGWFSLLATRASKWRNISWLFDKGLVCLLRHSFELIFISCPVLLLLFRLSGLSFIFVISARANLRFALHIIYVCTSVRRVTCARNPLAAKHRVAEKETNVNFSCFKSENWDGPQRSLSSPDNEELSLSLFRWRMSLDIYNLVDFFLLLLFFFSLVCFSFVFFFLFLIFSKKLFICCICCVWASVERLLIQLGHVCLDGDRLALDAIVCLHLFGIFYPFEDIFFFSFLLLLVHLVFYL